MKTWGRLYAQTRNHRKLKIVRRKHPDAWWVFYPLIEMAIECDARGRIQLDDGLPYSIDELSEEVHLEPVKLEAVLMEMERLRLIARDTGIIRLLSWSDRQYESDSSTDRVRRHREKKSNSRAEALRPCARDDAENGKRSSRKPETFPQQNRADAEKSTPPQNGTRRSSSAVVMDQEKTAERLYLDRTGTLYGLSREQPAGPWSAYSRNGSGEPETLSDPAPTHDLGRALEALERLAEANGWVPVDRDRFEALTGLIPARYCKLASVRRALAQAWHRHGPEYVERNIRYTVAHCRKSFTAYLRRAFEEDWGCGHDDHEELRREADRERELREHQERQRQAREDEEFRAARCYLENLPAEQQQALRERALKSLPPGTQALLRSCTPKLADTVILGAVRNLIQDNGCATEP